VLLSLFTIAINNLTAIVWRQGWPAAVRRWSARC